MKSTQKTRHALVTSVVCMVLCCAMLLGTTFAWFTDSVTNEGNVITAGNLSIDAVAYDVDMENTSSTSYQIDEVNGGEKFYFEKNGQDLKAEGCPPVIEESPWEPGKSNAKLLTVTNNGNLAAKIKLQFEVEDGGLQSALWFDFVQVKDGGVAGSFTRRPMSEINTVAQNLEFHLKADSSVSFILVYGMNESADNDYQGKSFSADVTVLATQDTVEADGFGNTDYDADATYTWSGGSDEEGLEDNTSATENTVTIETAEQLAAFANAVNEGNSYKGYTVTLAADIDLNNQPWTPIGSEEYPFNGTFDGNSHTIYNLAIDNANLVCAGLFGYMSNPGIIQNVTVSNAKITAGSYAGALIGDAFTGTLKDCTVTGMIDITANYDVGGLVGSGYASISGCKVEASAGSKVTGQYKEADSEGDNVGGLIGYRGEGNLLLTDCSVSGLTVTGTRKVGGLVGSAFTNNYIENCTVSNVTVASNATNQYIAEKQDSIGIGGIVGVFSLNGNGNGHLTGNTVENITLSGPSGVQMGYLTGGTRNSLPEIPAAPWYQSGNKVIGTNSGSNSSEDENRTEEGVYQTAVSDLTELKAAVSNAQDGDIIKLDQDITVGSSADKILWDNGATNYEMSNTKHVTIDLNGKTIHNTYNSPSYSNAIQWGGSSTLTLKNGTIDAGQGAGAILIKQDATLIMENVVINSQVNDRAAVKFTTSSNENVLRNVTINAKNGACLEANDATVDLYDCTFIQEGTHTDTSDWYHACITTSGWQGMMAGNVNIYSGTYTGKYAVYVLSSGGTVNIYGGTLSGELKNSAESVGGSINDYRS